MNISQLTFVLKQIIVFKLNMYFVVQWELRYREGGRVEYSS